MTTCRDYQLDFAAYLSGECPPNTALELTTHLETCKACRREMTAAEVMTTELPAALEIKAPAGLLPNILAECQESTPGHRNLQPFLRSAAIGLAAMLAVLVFRSTPPPPAPGGHASPQAQASRAFTNSELGTAHRDLAWTLTTTGRVLDHTSQRVLGDIFNRRIPRALSKSLHQTLTTHPKGRS